MWGKKRKPTYNVYAGSAETVESSKSNKQTNDPYIELAKKRCDIITFLSKKERCCICGECYPTAQLAHFTLSKNKRHDFQKPQNIANYYKRYADTDGLDRELRVPVLFCDITEKLPARHENKMELEEVCKEYVIKSIPFRTPKKLFCEKCLLDRIQQVYSCVDTFLEYVRDNKIVGKHQILTINTNEITNATKKALQKDAGDKGERTVEFELRWLPQGYISIEKDCISKYSSRCILLANPNYLDGISQEFDHIVVSAKGVFVIETKNVSGELFVDENGNWSRTVNGQTTGIPSPVSQLNKHCKVLTSIIGNVPIVKIICIANSASIITSKHKSDYFIVKYDCLCDFIENFDSKEAGFRREVNVNDVVDKINRHKVSHT